MMFSMSAEELQQGLDVFIEDVPDTLTSQFTERKPKINAVMYQIQRKSNVTQLYPTGVYCALCTFELVIGLFCTYNL